MRSHPNKAVDVVSWQISRYLLSRDQLMSPSFPRSSLLCSGVALTVLRGLLLRRSPWSGALGLLFGRFRQSIA